MESQSPLSLDALKPRMGQHSVGVINDILQFAQEANLESTEVSHMIAGHVASFLKTKADILSDYEECSDGGEAYLYPNRKAYRQNIYNVIQFVFAKDQDKNLGENISEELISTKSRLAAVLLATELEMKGEKEGELPSSTH